MKILCAILAVAVIALTVVLICKSRESPEVVQVEKTQVVVKTTERNPLSVETQHSIGQAEFFASNDAQTGVAGLTETSTSFDGTDGDYKDYVASKAIGNDVRSNHSEFIKDRIGPQSNYTGRNYTLPDGNDGDNYGSNWMGIRGRPQAVNIDNPDSLVDDDVSQYAQTQRIRYNQ
jgi:hypothetical protein